MSLELTSKLKLIVERSFSSDNEYAVKIEDAYKKRLHKDPLFMAMGIKRLIRREAGNIKFVINYVCKNGNK